MIDVFRFSSCRNMLVCACLQGVVGGKNVHQWLVEMIEQVVCVC